MRVHRNSCISMRKVAREIGISERSVRRIAKNELGIRSYKIQKAQLLTKENKRVRLERCKLLHQWHAGPDILFTDEKRLGIKTSFFFSYCYSLTTPPICHGLGRYLFYGKNTPYFCESWCKNQQRILPQGNSPEGCETLGQEPFRSQSLAISTGLCSGPQGKRSSGLVQGQFSWVH